MWYQQLSQTQITAKMNISDGENILAVVKFIFECLKLHKPKFYDVKEVPKILVQIYDLSYQKNVSIKISSKQSDFH